MKYMTRWDWRNFVLGLSSRGVDSQKTAKVIRRWIEVYVDESKTTLNILENMLTEVTTPRGAAKPGLKESEKDKVAILLNRWKQIQWLCMDALGATE
jgi:hypothetical protein